LAELDLVSSLALVPNLDVVDSVLASVVFVTSDIPQPVRISPGSSITTTVNTLVKN
jgi:hypothetical protein